jgi:hypothetical protein
MSQERRIVNIPIQNDTKRQSFRALLDEIKENQDAKNGTVNRKLNFYRLLMQ